MTLGKKVIAQWRASMTIGYAKEKLYEAILALAIGQGDVRSRLYPAYLCVAGLREDDFPKEFQKDWAWIMRELTKYGPTYKPNGDLWYGSVENTLRNIRNSTGRKIAEKIFDIGWALNTHEEYR
jgi:hypothetical protein